MTSIAMQLDAATPRMPAHSIFGQLAATCMTPLRRRQNLPPEPSRHTMDACMAALQDGAAHSTPAIAAAVGKSPDTVRHSMKRLVEEGKALKCPQAQIGKLRFSMWRKA